jgi:predicted nucleic acid-binding protein
VIVLDASVVIEVLLNTPAGIQIAERFFDPDETIHAPHLLDVEVAQVLRRYARTGELDTARGLQALQDLIDFPLIRYPHDLFLLRIWELRHNVTAYDASYIALAEALGALLLTRDAALASAPGNRARIELI